MQTHASSSRHWFVTSALQPDVPLDGPFASYAACETRCLVRTDRDTAARAMAAGHLPALYVPHLFETRIEEIGVRHYNSPRAAPPVVAAAPAGLLPSVVFGYTRGDLLALTTALGLPSPPTGADRAGILAHIEASLAELGKGHT